MFGMFLPMRSGVDVDGFWFRSCSTKLRRVHPLKFNWTLQGQRSSYEMRGIDLFIENALRKHGERGRGCCMVQDFMVGLKWLIARSGSPTETLVQIWVWRRMCDVGPMFFTLDRFRRWLTRRLSETSLSTQIMRGRGHCPHNLGWGRQQNWGGTLITFKSFLCGYPSSQLWRRVQQVEADGQCATSVCRPREFGWIQMRLYKISSRLHPKHHHNDVPRICGWIGRRFNMVQTCTIQWTQSSDSLLFRWEGTHVRMFKTVLNDSEWQTEW